MAQRASGRKKRSSSSNGLANPAPSLSSSSSRRKNHNTVKLPPIQAQGLQSGSSSTQNPVSTTASNSSSIISTNPTLAPLSSTDFKQRPRDVTGAEEWMDWCSKNNVLVGQTAEIQHYEIETCRRYFLSLKTSPSAPGVNLKTLAESFYRAEVFPSHNEALLFCQKLVKSGDTMVTFNDLLDGLHDKTFYKRNKITNYMKFIATSDHFDEALLELAAPSAAERKNSLKDLRRNSLFLNQLRNLADLKEKDSSESTGQGANQRLVIARHPSNGTEGTITVHPVTTTSSKQSLQRKDSSDDYKKYILRRSYTRAESIPPEKVSEEPSQAGTDSTPTITATVASSTSQPTLQKQESLGDGSPFKCPQRIKVAAIKIYANNKFLKSFHPPNAVAPKSGSNFSPSG